jgi:MFS family permease
LSKDAIVAKAGRNRWLIAPSALLIHLSIGQAYAFSVFNLPLSMALGVTKSTPDDWKLTQLGWIFTCAIGFLGVSAAVFGQWLERVGPRVSGLVAALCFSSGFLVAALGVQLHQLALIIFGYGVLGGVGLGLGYITPVSTLIKWFPDRRGMATGIAIMGFGGGAIIAAPLSRALMKSFASATSVGVAETFLVLAALYFVAMTLGALSFRTPPHDFKPPGAVAAVKTSGWLSPAEAIRTRQFYLLWGVLCLNVTAGIGVLGQASAMIQEVSRGDIDADGAAKFVSALSAANLVGRFFWASLSDKLGRRRIYAIFFSLGPLLYFVAPLTGSVPLFIACFLVILTMYGGGFATIPAYLSDLFGTKYVSAIHGRLLTAWSVAGVLGPVLVNYVRQSQIDSGVPKAQAYNVTLWLMAALLVVGFICNWRVKALPPDRLRSA